LNHSFILSLSLHDFFSFWVCFGIWFNNSRTKTHIARWIIEWVLKTVLCIVTAHQWIWSQNKLRCCLNYWSKPIFLARTNSLSLTKSLIFWSLVICFRTKTTFSLVYFNILKVFFKLIFFFMFLYFFYFLI
jgi:hypothetical protein